MNAVKHIKQLVSRNKRKLDRGLKRSSPMYGLSTPYSYPVPPCFFQHGRPAFGPSCIEFVYPECWHFDNDATSKIDDVLTEHGGLLHVLPLAVHPEFFLLDKLGGPLWTFLPLWGLKWNPSFMLKSFGVVGWVAHEILVSAQGPLVLGFWVWGLGA